MSSKVFSGVVGDSIVLGYDKIFCTEDDNSHVQLSNLFLSRKLDMFDKLGSLKFFVEILTHFMLL